MTKPWQLAPWLAVAALAASAWWWQTGKDAWRAPTARMPELPVVAELPSPPVFHAQQALERPVLYALLAQRQNELKQIQAERDELRNRVALLDPRHVDPDMAGQLLRSNLNVVHPDEMVMLLN